ncbi:MAG: hypothetical protein P8N09_01465 [Planctomycetota bacterium]|jgi:hypothetical protein|nr:hypothetical protein [Planctomycetota bacterium]
MTSSNSRTSTTLLLGAVVIILIGVYWMLDPGPRSDGSGVTTVAEPTQRPQGGTALPVEGEGNTPDSTSNDPEPLSPGKAVSLLPLTETASWEEDPLLVTGHVEDLQEKRLPDVEINLFDDSGDFVDSEFTDEQGVFRFYSDEPLAPGWSVGTEPEFGDPDDPSLLAPVHYTHTYSALPGKPPVYVKLAMGRPPRIEGKVFDLESGDPIDMADVEVVSLAPAWDGEYQDEFTDERGHYSMNLVDVPPTNFMIRFADDDDRYKVVGPLSLQPGEIRIIDVGLKDPDSLEGYVYSLGDNTPISGVEITVLPAHEEFESIDAWDVSGDDGEWAIDDTGTHADNIWLLLQGDDYGPVLTQVSDTSQLIRVGLGGQISVTGKLVDSTTGEPVTDGEVTFALKGPSGILYDNTDMDFIADDGTFSLLLELCPPNGAIVIVEADEYVNFRAPLSTLANTGLDLRNYEISIALTPLP